MPPSPNLCLQQTCLALGPPLAALLSGPGGPGDPDAPAGLRRALDQAQGLLVCAQGPAYWAAHSVRSSFFATAGLPVFIERPQDLEALGPGLWRLPGLLAWHGGDAEDLWGPPTFALAERYRCPVLVLGPAPTGGQTLGGPWAMAQQTTAADGGAFILAVVTWLMLAHLAARQRLSALGPQAARQKRVLAELEQALTACPAHLAALSQSLGPQGPQAQAVARVAGWLGRARQVFVLCDGHSLHAAQAWLAQRSPQCPRTQLWPMDDPTLPPPWAVMGPEDVCVLVCRDAQDAAAHQAACAQKRGAAVALVTAAGIRLPPSPGDGCALVLPGPQVLWPILVFGMLLALD